MGCSQSVMILLMCRMRIHLITQMWRWLTSWLQAVRMLVPIFGLQWGGDLARGNFRFSDWCRNPPPPEMLCAIRAISCCLGRRLTFFCREVLMPVYCM